MSTKSRSVSFASTYVRSRSSTVDDAVDTDVITALDDIGRSEPLQESRSRQPSRSVSVSLPEPPKPEEAVSCWSGWMLCMTPTPRPAAPPPTKKTAATPLLGEWGGRVVEAPAASSVISFQPVSGVADNEGMEYKPNVPLAGIIDDFRRRAAHYRSDWTDGLRNQRTLSAGLFMFFATFSSTVALGHVVSKKTDGAFGVCEYLLMNSFAGIFYSIVGCQPYVVLRPTGPITMLLSKLYAIAGAFGFEYFSFVATTGLWVGIYMAAISAFELCRYTRLLTRFTHDIFAFFVCSIYILDGVRGIFDRFADYKSAADPGNALLAMVMAVGARCRVLGSAWRAPEPHMRRPAARTRRPHLYTLPPLPPPPLRRLSHMHCSHRPMPSIV